MKSLFEQMGGTYRKEGDYFIPNLELPPTSDYQISKYGRMRRAYLKDHHSIIYSNLVISGTLFEDLEEVDKACNERMALLCTAMAKQEGVTSINRNHCHRCDFLLILCCISKFYHHYFHCTI